MYSEFKIMTDQKLSSIKPKTKVMTRYTPMSASGLQDT